MSANGERSGYPADCWWVAARGDEVGEKPLQRWIRDTPVLLYRTPDGTPVALDDRCPHRWAPLSSGHLEGDMIVCPYHGARFAPDGHCPRFPGQAKVPGTMRVRAFPLLERGPFIWIWTGSETARSTADLPPDFGWSTEPGWTVTSGYYKLDANYMLLHENVLDLSHFNYVHAGSFGITSALPVPRYWTDGNRVQFEYTSIADEMNDHERELVGLTHPSSEKVVTSGSFVTPALHQASATVHSKPNAVIPERMSTRIAHMLTPISARETHYWWFVGSDIPMPPEMRAGFGDLIRTGYLEDKVVLEAIQLMVERDPRGLAYPELSFQGDGGGILARRALERILQADGSICPA